MTTLSPAKARALRRGIVIPAHPLALTAQRTLDERHQRALTRYYLSAGAGGLAVAVHTTQFAIRDPRVGLFGPVLELAAETARATRPIDAPLLVAGVCGRTEQAIGEAQHAVELGYDILLLQLGAFAGEHEDVLVEHCRRIAEIGPLFGFYLQPAVGGQPLSYAFWRRFAEIPNALAIKIAPFNRYQTLDVVRAVLDAGRTDIALYTGNDDHIVLDLLAAYRLGENAPEVRIVGGLLGQWAVWTRRAVHMLDDIHALVDTDAAIPASMMVRANQLTDTNAALFDPVHAFHGSIAGIHEVLRRQGLLAGRWCLDPHEDLSPGQMQEIDRVYAAYPDLNDDAFVAEHLDDWLR